MRKSGSSTDQTVYRWWVPLTYSNNFNEPQKSAWLTRDQDNVSVSSLGATKDQWVIFNVQQVNHILIFIKENLKHLHIELLENFYSINRLLKL